MLLKFIIYFLRVTLRQSLGPPNSMKSVPYELTSPTEKTILNTTFSQKEPLNQS